MKWLHSDISVLTKEEVSLLLGVWWDFLNSLRTFDFRLKSKPVSEEDGVFISERNI